jgi:polysaccharide chain length determinant protein (PEP-CTERM system associated)
MNLASSSGELNMEREPQAESVFRDLLNDVSAHARGMWRFRWRAAIVAWMLCVVGWIAVYLMPPVYQANARVFVDTENAIKPLLQGIGSSSNVMNEVAVVIREMLSRPNLAEVARNSDLDLRVNTDEEFEKLIESLQKRIQVDGNRDNIFSISFQDVDRDKAVSVVDSLVNTFVEKSLGADRSESTQAQFFLQDQIKEYEARLTMAEDRLASFKRDNVAYMPDQRGDYFARLQAAKGTFDSTQTRLQLALERRTELLRQLEGEEPVFGIMFGQSDGTDGGYASAKIRQLEAQLEELRLQYTDKHPRIGQILDTIELLKQQQVEEELNSDSTSVANGPAPINPLDINPVYQNMRIQLTNTDVEIATLRAELTQQRKVADELKTLVDTVPRVEAELGRLNRDYDVVKRKYEQLLAQLETANIGESAGQSIDDVQFRIIDPPFANTAPVGPQRQLFLAAVLIGALGCGGMLTFLLNQLHPVFFSGRDLTQASGLPVLGSVGLLATTRDKRKSYAARLSFVTVIALLVVSYSLVSAFSGTFSPALRSLTGAG